MAATSAVTDEDRLRRIEQITDSTLSQLSVEDLLTELLDRVRGLLEADTAAVLLLDPSGTYLVATAARGIEEEVRQGVRVPLGKGFAGRVAATRGPIRLDRVDATTVANPTPWGKGTPVCLALPLLTADRLFAGITAGRPGHRPSPDQ